jgi:hypothetical protein
MGEVGMSRRAFVALASVVFALSIFDGGPVVARDDFRSGVWAGRAHPDDSGPFTGCTMSADYENGIALTFGLSNRYDFAMVMASRAWSLIKDDRYDVVYSIDGAQRFKATARSFNQHGVFIGLPNTRETFDRLRTGTALLVEAAGGRFRFDLGGTYIALELLLECVTRNVRSAGPGGSALAPGAPARPEPRAERPAPGPAPRPTPSPESPPRQAPAASAEARAIAAAFVEKLLLRAELYDFEILTGERVPSELRRFDVVWKGYHVFGTLEILPSGAYRTIDAAAADTVATHEKSCGGKLSSKGQALRLDDNRRLVRIAITCPGKDEVHLDYTLMPLAEGGFYRILHISSKDPDAGHAANERIGVAAAAMLSGK